VVGSRTSLLYSLLLAAGAVGVGGTAEAQNQRGTPAAARHSVSHPESIDAAKRFISAKDYATGLRILASLANKGEVEAQRLLGEMAYNGTGVSKDLAAAFAWNEKAANVGDRLAQFNLGYLYERGEGVSQSLTTALFWYEKSGAQGYGPAQHKVGDLARDKGDLDKAAFWYGRAASNGDEVAARKARESLDLGTAERRRVHAEVSAVVSAREREEARRAEAERRRYLAEADAKREETRRWMEQHPGEAPRPVTLPPILTAPARIAVPAPRPRDERHASQSSAPSSEVSRARPAAGGKALSFEASSTQQVAGGKSPDGGSQVRTGTLYFVAHASLRNSRKGDGIHLFEENAIPVEWRWTRWTHANDGDRTQAIALQAKPAVMEAFKAYVASSYAPSCPASGPEGCWSVQLYLEYGATEAEARSKLAVPMQQAGAKLLRKSLFSYRTKVEYQDSRYR
jgi:FOG: TPR repeat, SEL1 subfamily